MFRVYLVAFSILMAWTNSASADLTTAAGAGDSRAWTEFQNNRLRDEQTTAAKLAEVQAGEKFIGLELLLAGAGSGAGSQFGHSLIRFVTANPFPDDDPVFAFIADVNEPSPSVLKGIFGGYEVSVDGFTMADLLTTYAVGEGRTLKRYLLPSTVESRTRLAALLQKVFLARGDSSRRYSFFSANCAVYLERALYESGLTPLRMAAHLPTSTPKALRDALATPLPELTIIDPSQNADLIRPILQRKALESQRAGLKDVATQSLMQYALASLKRLPFDKQKLLVDEIRGRPDREGIAQDVFHMKAVSPELYEPFDRMATRALSELIKASWAPRALAPVCRFIQHEMLNYNDLYIAAHGIREPLTRYQSAVRAMCDL